MSTITLATLHKATAQQVFDQAARHLLTQGRKSLSASGLPAYRGTDGLKCAAGCFIADDEYTPTFEPKRWYVLTNSDYVPQEHWDLITRVQAVHDGSAPYQWPAELTRVAERFDLSPAVLSEFTQ